MRFNTGHLLFVYSAFIQALHRLRPVRNPRRILIYRLDHLGDLLLTTPSLRLLRQRFPNAEIVLAIGEWTKDIVRGNPYVDRVVFYNSGHYARPPYTGEPFRNFKKRLGTWKPDLIIGFREDWAMLHRALFSTARYLGRGIVQLSEYIDRGGGKAAKLHEVEECWRVIRSLKISKDQLTRPDYFITDEERADARSFMSEHNILPGFAAIHAGVSNPLREWPVERFAETARQLYTRYNKQIVLIGSPAERNHSDGVSALLGDVPYIDVTGMRSFRQTVALLEQAGLYIGSDGGLVHISSTLGINTLGLYGPGDYNVFKPLNPNGSGIYHKFPCSPCLQITCIRPDDSCMNAITVEEVMTATAKLLGSFKF